MSLFKRAEARAITYQDMWGADAISDIRADFATLVPVFSAVRLLADAVAQTPLHAYDEGGRLESQPSFLSSPGPSSTAYDWKYRMVYSLLIRGYAAGAILGVGRDGWPTGVEWLDPSTVSVLDDTNTANPQFLVNGQPVPFGSLLYIPAFPVPGRVMGISPLRAFAMTSEVGWQALRFARDWLKTNGVPSATLQHQRLDEIPADTSELLKAKFKAAAANRDLVVFGKDWKLDAVTMPADEARFLSIIKATANQVAAIYGVPPERIGGEAASSRSYANLDMDLRYVRSTSVAGWLTQIEQALSVFGRRRQWVSFNMDAGIRSDTLTRMQAHEIALRTGVETLDEARAVEDKAPLTPDELSKWASVYRPQSTRQETSTP